MKNKITLSSVIFVISILMIFKIPYFTQTQNNLITLLLEFIITVYLVSQTNYKKYLKANICISIFMMVAFSCTLINVGIESRLITSFVSTYEYVVVFSMTHFFMKRKGLRVSMNLIWRTVTPIIVIVDLCIVLTQGKGIGGSTILPYYIIGNKFTVSYLHMLYLSMFAVKRFYKTDILNKFILCLFILYSTVVCYIVDCNTGVVGCLTIGLLLILRKKVERILINKYFYISFIVGLSFILIGTDLLLDSIVFQNIITNVFKRDITWTGRLDMFKLTVVAFYKRPLFGYGINSTYIREVLGWGNAQNGLLKILLDYGLIGLISFLYICKIALKSMNESRHKCIYPVICFLYGMAVCTTVEINISSIFFFGLALVNAVGKTENEKALYNSKEIVSVNL